ncbi:MAG: hypothetical protein MUF15_22845 [Acidobacteria bacterium]|jgi:hypothetical protein|nr:hypothetical protein [Acidobacteriota bacterium]
MGLCDVVIVFIDPLNAHPHIDDIQVNEFPGRLFYFVCFVCFADIFAFHHYADIQTQAAKICLPFDSIEENTIDIFRG